MKKKIAYKNTAQQPVFHRVCALVLVITTTCSPTLSSAAGLFPGLIGRTATPFVPTANMLPVLFPGFTPDGAAVTTNGTTMTITQNQGKDKVVIDWQSFNSGRDTLIRFYQGVGTPGATDWNPNSNYAALNRIYDLNPSVINGRLQADGRVYMINRNGVFFGPDSKVQVQSLVASTFNISDENFKNGRLIFNDDHFSDPDPNKLTPISDDAAISNEGDITTHSGGSVFFVGPNVQNLGKISAPGGKIDLVGLKADGQVEIKEILQTRGAPNDVIYSDISKAGHVANMAEGSLHGDDGGWIGLYGSTVRNDGLIRAVTTRRQNGVVYLSARDLVATGQGSDTDVEVSESAEAMGRNALAFTPGNVTFSGLFQKGAGEAAAPISTTLARIDHEGSITAHSGNVTMEAVERVFLGEKSNIDVSGLSIERSMADQFIEAQLNSLYLRDDYGQKQGDLLPGSTVTIDVLEGSSMGDLSSYYLGMPKNARDLSTVGGNISIGALKKAIPGTSFSYTLGDIIISKGAGFDISGGKVTYSGIAPASTKLIASDGRVYDISNAPQWSTYTGMVGSTTKSYGKFGSETLKGISFGGHLIALKSKPDDRVVGGSAGSLSLSSKVILGLNDDLNLRAAVTTGLNQTVTTSYLESDKNSTDEDSPEYQRYQGYLISMNRGLEAPTGGRLSIGTTLSTDLSAEVAVLQSAAVNSVEVKKTVTAATQGLSWDDRELLDGNSSTVISADMINRLYLGALEINANTAIKTDSDAGITLRPGGSYIARGRRIEFLGSVTTAGGTVEMTTRPNITSFEKIDGGNNPLYNGDLRETIFLGDQSRISTAGEQIDNSTLGLSTLEMRKGGFTSGGSISLLQLSVAGGSDGVLTRNNENSVVIKDGALLDVSGGYLIDEKGTVSGGDAGSLTVKSPTISLGGDLRGFSLPGKDGGELVLHAQEVQVAVQGRQLAAGFGMDDVIPDDYPVGKLVLGADRFKNSGFSRISLSATNNITVDTGVVLAPSLLKRAAPGNIAATGSTCSAGSCFSISNPTFLDQIGKTYISFNAGSNVYGSGFYDLKFGKLDDNSAAKLTISADATVATAPGGTISLNAPLVEIAGTISASGGSVTAKASNGALIVRGTGQILAAGYNKTGVATKADQPAPLPVAKAGGTVKLDASNGKLDLENGSLVDVSGSDPVSGDVRNDNGTLTTVTVAGDAGSLSLVYGTGMLLEGTISGAGKTTGARNGSLTVKNTIGDLTINSGEVGRYQSSGFDDLTFSSQTKINLPTSLNLSIGRGLTLDSPLIQGTGVFGETATISAPWIKLVNTGIFAASAPGSVVDNSGGTASFIGEYLDVQGSLLMQGFSDIKLQAKHDMTFADYYNSDPSVKAWLGTLGTSAANLTLQAARIYPTTASNFTITTPGKTTTTILPGDVRDTSPIYSAGGSLTIAADGGIYHNGFLAAPLGSITLDGGASGTVELSEESVITTAGSAPVAYGDFDSSKWWAKYVDNSNTGAEVTAAPDKSITLKGKEVVVRDGAIQDLSGGGSVYASYWQSGIPGTYNPLTVTGRYVILPDGSATRPGNSIYLEAMPELGLKAGVYSILPIEFAFVPGALVIQDTGQQLLAGQQTISKEKYPVVGGYMTVRDTSVASQVYTGFSVRRAEDVIKEGDFTVKSFIGGDGGSFTLNASNGAYFGGTLDVSPLDANPLAAYRSGIASFAARNVEIVNDVTEPDFSQPLSDTLQLAGDTLSGMQVSRLLLGDKDTTSEVTVQDGISLKAAAVTLSAADKVTLKAGAQVEATGSGADDYASIVTPGGVFDLGDGALLKAKTGIKLDVKTYTLSDSGVLDTGGVGYFSLTADRITMDDATETFWKNTFANNRDLAIASRGEMDLKFTKADVTLKTGGSLTLDASRYIGTNNVSFESLEMTLLNSGATSTASTPAASGTVSFSADQITIAPGLNGSNGNIAFDQSVKINSKNDLILKGEGSLTTRKNLDLSAARVTTAADTSKADGSYVVANITLDGRDGAVTLNGSQKGGTAGTASTPGGSLQILGDSITQTGGLVEVAAGQIGLTASNDISINGIIKATGNEQTSASGEKVYYNGGKITVRSDGGKLNLRSGGNLDVSASAQGDAGAIALSAANGGVSQDSGARLAGAAGANGKGGSLSIDSANLDGVGGLDGLSSTLSGGGFNELLNIRSRAGDLALTNGKTLSGREVVVAADNGSITVGGTINADSSDGGGRIELYSDRKLTLESRSVLSAMGKAAGANGGTVILSSQDGSDNKKAFNGDYALNVNSGSTIDVSSGYGGKDGTVAFRAYQGKKQTGDENLNDVNIGTVNGAINGASGVSVEAVRAYADRTNVGAITEYGDDAEAFMTAAAEADTKKRLFASDAPVNHFQAGIEISSAADTNLNFDTAWDLKSLRPGGEAGVVTLKSTRDLNVNQILSDAPTSLDTIRQSTLADSWGVNLIAGSDGGANYMGVKNGSALTAGSGNLVIAANKVVYSQNAPINFAAGNDVTMKGWNAVKGPSYMVNADMKYNLGSYGGAIRGDVGRDINFTYAGSAIQTALGNIDIRTGRDLNLGSVANTGAIRTTGEFDDSVLVAKQPGLAEDTVADRKSYWTYHNGGSINLDVGNAVNGNLNAANGWDGAYVDGSLYNSTGAPLVSFGSESRWFYLAAGFGGKESGLVNIPVTVGIATMGGGDVSVRTGGSLLTQIGAFGKGDIAVTTGGDMTGRFRIMNGNATLTSAGGFGKDDFAKNPTWRSTLELADARVSIAAMGDVQLGSVQNPDNSRDRIMITSYSSNKPWNMTYTEDTAFSATSLFGDANLYGTNHYAGYSSSSGYLEPRKLILPASFALSAGGDINVEKKFVLAPSHNGNLELFAKGSIRGTLDSNGSLAAGFKMQDVDIASMYGRQEEDTSGYLHYNQLTGVIHSGINHLEDAGLVKIRSGKDIADLDLYLNKPAEVTAGGDINRLKFIGQNTASDSLSSIKAGGNIDQGISVSAVKPSIEIGGPGTLLVQAGGNILLGNSEGVNSVGNANNGSFSGTGVDADSDLIVSAGAYVSASMAKTDVKEFFDAIRDASDRISRLKADGKDAEAETLLAETEQIISKYFYTYDEKKPELAKVGNLDMVDSAISSRAGSIYVMAGSNMNIGKSAISNAPLKTSGITTLYGGQLSVYAGNDINVNESRLMTYLGGDITIWSDQGNINAGRGSKTVVSAPTPVYNYDPANPEVLTSISFTPPSAGSGIRALTFDSDGSGPVVPPLAGDIHIYAKGTLDAGEAGIQGNKLMIAASAVLNSQNIGFSAGSVGVPASNQNTVSIGPMTGATDITNDKRLIETISGGGEAARKTMLAEAEDFLMKYLDVKVIDLSEETL
ncbi:MAG: hypothetical protein A2X82_01505 [Geobacteraceae bacterium GWC2_55_20]|nr:MAG: hypothetical protein A2X82_01505 [Geobacteraceae bacterium GWC2_55_20]OGU24833.1 MAG: hypothetical protein A2X85_00535 [Geobacteraceae bacterium GWF2_54_21]HCE67621.1 hypothetical protein [Geobacter sp.]